MHILKCVFRNEYFKFHVLNAYLWIRVLKCVFQISIKKKELVNMYVLVCIWTTYFIYAHLSSRFLLVLRHVCRRIPEFAPSLRVQLYDIISLKPTTRVFLLPFFYQLIQRSQTPLSVVFSIQVPSTHDSNFVRLLQN